MNFKEEDKNIKETEDVERESNTENMERQRE